MSEFQAVWLGIVQGLTEFLPVSSSGHLVLFQTWFGVEGQGGLLFEIAVHVATLLAILIVYRRRIAELAGGVLRGRAEALRYAAKLGVATLPVVPLALLAKSVIELAFATPVVTGLGLLVTGLALWTTRWTIEGASAREPGWWAALLIGCAQALALLPGVSRSGSTVAAALALGVAPAAAAEFSFLLGVVAISGAAVLTIPAAATASTTVVGSVALGAVAAVVSGLFAIRLFLRLLEHRGFYRFAYYTWTVGGLFLLGLWIWG